MDTYNSGAIPTRVYPNSPYAPNTMYREPSFDHTVDPSSQ